MKLTGKCKIAFLNYYWENKIKPLKMTICKREDLEAFFDTISEVFQNALIIEFFDSIKYIANQSYWEWWFYQEYKRTRFLDYKKATNAAIEKANILFNSK